MFVLQLLPVVSWLLHLMGRCYSVAQLLVLWLATDAPPDSPSREFAAAHVRVTELGQEPHPPAYVSMTTHYAPMILDNDVITHFVPHHSWQLSQLSHPFQPLVVTLEHQRTASRLGWTIQLELLSVIDVVQNSNWLVLPPECARLMVLGAIVFLDVWKKEVSTTYSPCYVACIYNFTPLYLVLTECTGSGSVSDQCDRRCTCQNGRIVKCVRLRKDWASLTTDERSRYVNAVLAISSQETLKGRYEALISKYKDSYETAAQSSTPAVSQFFVFNRFFLLEYENLLRVIDCRITIPYWDWTALPLTPYISAVWANQNGFGNTSRSTDNCVTKGPFRVGVFSKIAAVGGGCIQREYKEQTYPTRAIVERDLLTRPGSAFNEFQRFFQVFIHTNVRCFIGGTMCSVDAPNDPAYLLHLSMVDYIYNRWQRLSSDRLSARYANDNTALALSGEFTVTQFHNNDNLPNGVAVSYTEPSLKTHAVHHVAQAQQSDEKPSKKCEVNPLVKPKDEAFFKEQCARTWGEDHGGHKYNNNNRTHSQWDIMSLVPGS